MNFKSIEDLNKDIINNLNKIPKDIDLVVGIPRSGLLVANIISLHLNTVLVDLDGFLNKRVFESGKTRRTDKYEQQRNNPKKILVVEDSIHSGKSILEAKEKILNVYNKDVEIIYFAAYVLPGKENLVDIYLDKVDLPRVFEWNIMHHPVIENTCFDLDGVLCVDPLDSQDDDGENYINFLNNVETLFIPSKKIGNIVTCRLEKYREDTENWLLKNGIRYNNLIMMEYKSKEERIKAGRHAHYKAKHYNKTDCDLFIESSLNQAIEISKISQKPVYCIEVRKMIYPNSNDYTYGSVTKKMKFQNLIRNIKRRIKRRIKR